MKRRRGIKVKRLSVQEIREAANGFRSLLGLDEPAIDVINLLDSMQYAGVGYDVWERSEMGDDEARCLPDEYTILIREDVFDAASEGKPRARFTMAHEFGHLLMHSGVSPQLARTKSPIHHWEYDSEWQADTFAAELLMPADQVVARCKTIQDIQNIFNVSWKAASIRFQELKKEGLIK